MMKQIAIPNDPEVGVELVRNIALFYYLNIVLTAMNEGAFSFPCSYPILSRFNHELRRQILDAIDKENVFLEAGIWNGLQHPNQDIAMGFLCALSTLLNTDDQDVQACLHAPGVSVVRKIRAIAEGRHKHTSTCLEILFPVLSSENWIDETFDVYGEIEVVLGDIAFSARTPILKRRNISVRSRLVSEMLVEFIRCTSEKCSAVMQSLINKSFYKRAIDHLGMRFISKEGIENLCYVLSEFGALCHKLEVKMTEDKKAAKKSERQKFRSVYANLSRNEIRLMALYCDSANGKVQMSCRAKTLLLQCLKRLLKMPVNYDPIRKDLEFHEKIVEFCRDATDFECNRSAWRLALSILKHHPLALDAWIGMDVMRKLVNLIQTHSPPIVNINGLEFLTKFLWLGEKARSKYRTNSKPFVEQRKRFQRFMSVFCSFLLEKTLFVQIHMVYERSSAGSKGLCFQRCVALYQAIAKLDDTAELYAELRKKPKYEEAFLDVLELCTTRKGDPLRFPQQAWH
eukprot:TRINITY_DN5682_c0_g1_i6.p1 TRINITY_DN5682_c0_g1~~TRINITY_DN5682_c0_g1_i6.p1  ORF type:complete len:513 (-),score=117.66 TRINITY_DN5682_c0_g1_i6:913-2451(-)